ncbi:LysE family translocator [Methylobacterium sp. E-066]|uniref:LysE family translocator n=1 Tax=Methylobacterium sp. E-066 TaxID=2836584 RepID=UPI001FB98C4B|nr:LysE family translocator [Methylobacterium sp. E-066]MCJ2141873.1 LysE family translocator [Methylobacterium sp. E-066]
MSFDLLLAVSAYAFVTSITPGPNNAMLLASGVNFGFRRSIPHVLGIAIGFSVMVLAVGLGLGAVFAAVPALHSVLQGAGMLFLLYLAFNIARSGGGGSAGGRPRPMSFLQGALFQWVNPKAWIMALGAVTTYAAKTGSVTDMLGIAALFAVINAPCVAIWAWMGRVLRDRLADPVRRRAFNVCMAALLVASLVPLLTG